MKAAIGRTYIRSVALAGYEALVRSRGGDPEALLAEAGAVHHRSSYVIGWDEACAAFEVAADRLGEPDFGIAFAANIPEVLPNAATAMLLAARGDTMVEWLGKVTRYWHFYTNAYAIALSRTPDGGLIARMELAHNDLAQRQIVEGSFAGLCRLWQSLAGRDDPPIALHFRHDRPASLAGQHELFGPGLQYGQAQDQIQFSREQALSPIEPDEDRQRALVDWLLRDRIDSSASYDQSMSHTVAIIIASTLGSGVCNLDFVAASLSLNPKKLQRLLAQEDTTFSALLNSVREQLAIHLLTDTEIVLSRIAGMLDYAATAPFSMAVYRWTGLSPAALRLQRRQQQAESENAPESSFQPTAR